MKQIALLNLTLLFSCFSNAAPIIQGIEGSVSDGETIRVIGEGFSLSDAETLFWDKVDNHETIIHKNQVEAGQSLAWANNGSPWTSPVIFDTEQMRNNRKASYGGGVKSYLKWPNAIKDKNLQNIYVSWWFKPNIDPRDNGGSNKIIRIWDNTSGDDTRISWTTMHLQSTDTSTSWGDWGGKTGEWNRFEIWANSQTGQLKTWVNGTLTHNKTDFKKLPSSYGFNIYLIGFDPSEPERYPGFKFNMSDIYISATIARVEITNSPTWEDQNAIREIQPVQSWSDDEVTFTINSGSFENLSSKYLYVIDKNGIVNSNGYALCSKCPDAPTLVIE